jgi:hypothetical protein
MGKSVLVASAVLALLIAMGAGASVVSKATTEVLEATVESAARKSGRTLEGAVARKAVVEQVEGLTRTYGDDVLRLVEDGGLEFVEAVPKYGDDMVKLATKASPQARRVLALNPEELVPLSRRVGVDAIELEAKVPGQATHVFELFGDDGGRYVARNVRSEDLPRLIKYGEMADGNATRRALIEAYEKEGKSLFARIPPKLVLASGLTAAMLYGTHEASQIAGQNPGVFREIVNHATSVAGAIVLVVVLLLLWRFGLMPWQRKARPTSTPSSMSSRGPDAT